MALTVEGCMLWQVFFSNLGYRDGVSLIMMQLRLLLSNQSIGLQVLNNKQTKNVFGNTKQTTISYNLCLTVLFTQKQCSIALQSWK